MNLRKGLRVFPISLVALAAACSSATPSAETSAAKSDDQGNAEPATAKTSDVAPASALNAQAQRDWRKAMSRIATPTEGCFKATPPSTTWEKVPCGTAPQTPFVPAKAGGAAPSPGGQDTGGSTDYFASSTGTISWSEGSFPYVSNLTSAVDGTTDNFSLQLNSNFFSSSPLCSGAKDSSCLGWQQFIYAPGAVFMQYWLINYGNACPSGWNTYEGSCWRNSVNSASVATQPIGALGGLVMTATAGATDTVTFWTPDGTLYAASEANVVDLKNHWTGSEFNIFGNAGGSKVLINDGATIAVQTLTNSTAGTTAPSCVFGGWTAESTNLTLVPSSCCTMGGAEPGIRFTESDAPGATAIACPVVTAKPAGSGIAASRQFGLNQTDVASVDNNGQLNLTWADVGQPWNEAVTLSGTTYPAGAPVAMSQQFGLTQTDLFAVDLNGNLTVSWVSGAGNWAGPATLWAGQFRAGAELTASQQFGANQTDVFAIDRAGALALTSVANGGGWTSHEISGPRVFPSGAPVAATQQFGLTQTDVFAIDNTGKLNVMWAPGNGNFAGPGAIGDARFPAGAHLATSRQFGLDQTDVFAIDNNGALTVTWVSGGGTWSGPVEISSTGVFPKGAPVFASQQFGSNQTDVFAVNNNGDLVVMWAIGGGRWQGPSNISTGNRFVPGSNVTASNQFGLPSQTDVFVTDRSGLRTVSWVNGGGNWNGPVAIP